MNTPDLKALIEEIEERRKKRELYQVGFGLFVLTSVLAGGALLLPGFGLNVREEIAHVPEVPRARAFDDVVVSAKAAVVYDLTTGEILYEKNAEAQLPLASLTKLLTLYAASGALSPTTPITVSAKAVATEGESGFGAGETFTFEELAKLALVASSNDAAAAIAEAAINAQHATNGGALLASAASAIGLTQTYALNGTGLDENQGIAGAYGSAHDMAKLAGELVTRIPTIARASLSPTVTASALSGNSYTLKNTNPGTARIPGLMLSKTGYTDLAGGNLAVVYDAGINHPIAVVVLGSTKEARFTDVETLVRATAAEFAGLSL